MTRQFGLSRRGFIGAGAATAVIGSMGAPARAQAKELVVGHWGGAGPKTIRSAILPELQAKFAGSRIFIREGGDLDRKAMLEANPNNPEIDVYYLSGIDAKQLAERGLTDLPDPKLVPELADMYPLAKDGAYGVYLHALAIIYNPEKAKPESWFDLWKPEYRGRISVPNSKTIVNQGFVVTIIRAMGGKETNPKDVEEARKKLLELKPNIVVQHTGTSQALTVMKSGDTWLSMAVAGYAYQAKEGGQAVDVLLPKEGALGALDAIGVAKNSKNKEMAYEYVRMAMSPKVQAVFADENYWGPTNGKTQLAEKTAAKVVHGEAAVAKLITPDWAAVTAMRAEWIDWWDKNMV